MKQQTNRNIQVLRGVAVIGVIFFHAFPKIFKNGYLGVDIFFLISGFVIAPLLEKIKEGNLTLSDFFRRRFWRLAPALILTLFVSLPLLTLLGKIGYLKIIYIQAISALTLTGNLTAYRYMGNYFNPEPNPLIHTWSLSVEQQIYLLIPIIILLIKKVNKKFKLFPFYIWSGVISFLISSQINSYNEVLNFYSPIYRYYQFSLGALIYYLSRNSLTNKLTNLTIHPIIPLVAIFFLFVLNTNNFIYIILIVLICYKRLFIVPFPNNKSFQLLELIGDKSYSLYLVHSPVLYILGNSPVLQFIGIKPYNYLITIIGLVLTWIVGSLLNKKIENRFRKYSKINIAVLSPIATILILAIIGLMMANQGFGFKQTVLNRPVNQMDPGYINCSIMTSDDVCKLSNRKLKKVLIIGDSHAGSITATILKNVSPYGSVDSFLRSGCQYVNYINTIKFKPEFQYCYEYSKNVEQIVKDGNYDLIIAHYRSSTLNPILNKGWKYYTKIKIESLSQLANTYQLNVVLLGPTPEFPSKPQFFDPNRLLIEGSEIPSKLISRQDMNEIPFLENEEYKKFEYLNPFTIKYIDLIDNFCNYKNCSRWDSGWLYSDIDHLSALGAEKIDKDLKQLFGIN